MSVELEDRPSLPDAGQDVPGEKHIARASGLRWDGTIETLCGEVRRRSLTPRPHARRCEACQEIMRGIIEMEVAL